MTTTHTLATLADELGVTAADLRALIDGDQATSADDYYAEGDTLSTDGVEWLTDAVAELGR